MPRITATPLRASPSLDSCSLDSSRRAESGSPASSVPVPPAALHRLERGDQRRGAASGSDLISRARVERASDAPALSPVRIESMAIVPPDDAPLLDAEVALSQIAGIESMRTDWGWYTQNALETLSEGLASLPGVEPHVRDQVLASLAGCRERIARWDECGGQSGAPETRALIQRLAAEVIEEAKDLAPGGFLLLPGGWTAPAYSGAYGHLMLFEVRRGHDDTFSFVVHNTGNGVERHQKQKRPAEELEHARKFGARGEKTPSERYACAYIREKISREQLLGLRGQSVLEKLIHLRVAETKTPFSNVPGRIYEAAQRLGRPHKIDPKRPSPDLKLDQPMGNCGWKSALSFVRSHLPERTYVALKDHILERTIAGLEARAPRLIEEARVGRDAQEKDEALRAKAEALADCVRRDLGSNLSRLGIPPAASPLTALARLYIALGEQGWNRQMRKPEQRALFEALGGNGPLAVWVSEEIAPDRAKGVEELLGQARAVLERRKMRRKLDERFQALGVPRAEWRRAPVTYTRLLDAVRDLREIADRGTAAPKAVHAAKRAWRTALGAAREKQLDVTPFVAACRGTAGSHCF